MSVQRPSIKLNSLQQMMLKWTELTPYNAAHVISLYGTSDVSKWKIAAFETIRELQLGIPQFSKDETQVEFTPVNDLLIELPEQDLDAHIQSELNRLFLKIDFPIRFFIIQKENFYYFGAVYNHWVSDSYSIRALFQRIYQRYKNGESSLSPLTLHAPPFRILFKKYLGIFSWMDGIKEFVRCSLHFQSAYRIKLNNIMDFNSGFLRYELQQGLIDTLSTFAKQQGVSLNDIFLTALTRTFAKFSEKDRAQKKRKKFRLFARNRLAVGTIVDIRYPVQEEIKNVVGQYLSNFTVMLKNPDQVSLETLLKQIHQQTMKIKKSLMTIKNFASWDVALYVWKYLATPKSRARFFTKNTPVIAGISNVNLTPTWVGEAGDQIRDYLRISPVGLLIPAVFTVTTLHDRLSLCVSYRTTAFSKEEMVQLIQSFTQNLTSLIDGSKQSK